LAARQPSGAASEWVKGCSFSHFRSSAGCKPAGAEGLFSGGRLGASGIIGPMDILLGIPKLCYLPRLQLKVEILKITIKIDHKGTKSFANFV